MDVLFADELVLLVVCIVVLQHDIIQILNYLLRESINLSIKLERSPNLFNKQSGSNDDLGARETDYSRHLHAVPPSSLPLALLTQALVGVPRIFKY